MRHLDDIVLEIHADGLVLNPSLPSYSSEYAVELSSEDAATLAGRLLIAAGAASTEIGNPFDATLAVLRRGFHVFLDRLAKDAALAAGEAAQGAELADLIAPGITPDLMTARAIALVDCPECGSGTGDRCVYPSGRYHRTGAHAARIDALSEVGLA